MENMKNDLKVDMEGLKEGLTKLIQEMIPNGEKAVEETHGENKINVNRDFITLMLDSRPTIFQRSILGCLMARLP